MDFRHELKHQVNNFDLLFVRKRLECVAKRDRYSQEDGSYFVKSLYFDNYSNKALREKLDGVDKREKFRIRLYNNDTSFIRLEKKSKINGLCMKESCMITPEECQRIINNDYGFLIKSSNPLMHELYAKMNFQLLRPKNIVAYRRESFVYPAGNTRVTLDSGICGSYNIKSFLTPDTVFTQLFNHSIVEVKWDEYLPQLIADAVGIKNRKHSSFSKYAAVRF